MTITSAASYALVVLAGAALLTGCNSNVGLQSSGLTPSSGLHAATSLHNRDPLLSDTGDPSGTFAGTTWMGDAHPARGKSGFAPDVQRAPRLFMVSDAGTDAVYAFTMPDMNFKGEITGLNQPQGECSDRHGNFYVANTRGLQVLEYSRSGDYLNTYPDKYGFPVGCAVNPLNGDLAVTNIRGFNHGHGEVLIYASPSSSPTVLTNPKQYYYYFDGYDIHGDLWVDGRTLLRRYILSSCSASSCSTIKLSGGKIYFPGAVQWDQTEYSWVLFDQLCEGKTSACSYWVSSSGVLGQATNYENYNGGPICDLVQGVVAAYGKKYTAGSDYGSTSCVLTNSANRWQYPAGGAPTNYATKVLRPVGAAITTKNPVADQ